MNGYMTDLPILAVIIPFAAAFMICIFGERFMKVKRTLAVAAAISSIICMSLLVKPVALDGNIAAFWMNNWIPEGKLWAAGIGIQVDSLGLFTALIISAACLLSSIYSVGYMKPEGNLEKYYALLLTMLGGALGVVLGGDLFNMYIMIEIMTLSAAALIAFNNKMHKSVEAGFKYLIISSVASSFILLGVVLLYAQAHTLNLAQLAVLMYQETYSQITILAFALMLVGFLVKIFVFPCYFGWLDAGTAGPVPISMIISCAVGSAGIYALIRMMFVVFQVNGNSGLEYMLLFLGLITMLTGIIMAYKQTEFRRLLTYHLICQMGFVITNFGVGMSSNNSVSVNGIIAGLYGILNFVISGSILILCSGAVMHAAGTTDMDRLGGLAKRLPFTAVMFIIGAASFCGVPLLTGFTAKWSTYHATFNAGFMAITVISIAVSIMITVSFVTTGRTIFFGNLSKENENVKEIPHLMRVPVLLLSIACIVFGTVPDLINKYLIKPAAASIYDMSNYIDTMFVQGYALKMFKEKPKVPNMDNILGGYGHPAAWVILFMTFLIALILLISLYLKSVKDEDYEKSEVVLAGRTHIFGAIIGARLLSWLKEQLNFLFSGLQMAHNGSVNDYVLWIVTCLAVIIIYLFAVL